MLRVFSDVQYRCGLDGSFAAPELDGWLKLAHDLRDSFCKAFDLTHLTFGSLPGIQVGNAQVLIVHPLWDWTKPSGILAQAIATVPPDKLADLKFLDTFNVQRRMSWAYQTLRG
jgi:DEAD/DEAH box helicase domain-containing protein